MDGHNGSSPAQVSHSSSLFLAEKAPTTRLVFIWASPQEEMSQSKAHPVIQPTILPTVIIYSHNQMRAQRTWMASYCSASLEQGKSYPNSNSDRMQDAGAPAPLGSQQQEEGWDHHEQTEEAQCESSESGVPMITRESSIVREMGWCNRISW